MKIDNRIKFVLNDDEMVEARAVKQFGKEMLLIATDCLKREYPMYSNSGINGEYGDYEESDLRKYLNEELLYKFPEWVRDRMMPFENGDMLSIPSKREICGINDHSEKDNNDINQFECMKHVLNRIAFKGYGGDKREWYWLRDRENGSDSNFGVVGDEGGLYYGGVTFNRGIRVIFKMTNVDM